MKCRKCRCDLTDANWYASMKKNNNRICKDCQNLAVKNYNFIHRDELRKYHRDYGRIYNQAHHPHTAKTTRGKYGVADRAWTPPTKMVDALDMSWAAGFFDAEGNISRSRRDGLLHAQITNNDILLLAKFRVIVGVGTIVRAGGSFKYHTSGQRAIYISTFLGPYLRSTHRRNQIKTIAAIDIEEHRFSDTEALAWLGGFFDGEGSVGLYELKRRHKTLEMFTITNTERGLLEFSRETFGIGGSVYESKANRKRGWQPCFKYSVTYAKARQAAAMVLPYIHSKQKQSKIEQILGLDIPKRGRPKQLTTKKDFCNTCEDHYYSKPKFYCFNSEHLQFHNIKISDVLS